MESKLEKIPSTISACVVLYNNMGKCLNDEDFHYSNQEVIIEINAAK